MRRCSECGEMFEENSRNQKYCSKECRDDSYQRRRNPYGMETSRGYAEDCAHLHACRRLSKMVCDGYGLRITRGCDSETCSAYAKNLGENYWIAPEDAVEIARDGVGMIRGGYNSYDVYCTTDFAGTRGYLVEISG